MNKNEACARQRAGRTRTFPARSCCPLGFPRVTSSVTGSFQVLDPTVSTRVPREGGQGGAGGLRRLAAGKAEGPVCDAHLPSSVPRQTVGMPSTRPPVLSGSRGLSSAGTYTMHRTRDSTLKHSMTLGLEF